MTLKDIRTAAGLTQLQVSELSGIAQGNYCNLEKSNRISIGMAEKLAPIFKMTWYELVEELRKN